MPLSKLHYISLMLKNNAPARALCVLYDKLSKIHVFQPKILRILNVKENDINPLRMGI